MKIAWLLLLTSCFSFGAESPIHYCIIGAGPSGLQMGYFMERAGRDYIIFEKNDVPGSFYVKYPRHRKLISINKGNTGRMNAEFNLRHDWNSLISDDADMLFSKYSSSYFPSADELLLYLRDFATRFNLKIKFQTTIVGLYTESNGYKLTDQHGNAYVCRKVIIGTGFSIPHHPQFNGSEFVEFYDNMSMDIKDYKGKSVLIVGSGNSAMETATNLYGVTNFVHTAFRGPRVKLSWETHYVGDIRGVNNELIDAYMLKSLDAVLTKLDLGPIGLERREDGKIVPYSDGITPSFWGTSKLFHNPARISDKVPDNDPLRDGWDKVLVCTGFKWDSSLLKNKLHRQMSHEFYHQPRIWMACSTLTACGLLSLEACSQIMEQIADLFGLTQKAATETTSTESESTSETRNNKFPGITNAYESTMHKDLFFVGAITHSIDHRKSAGGFIHGYRYTARCLHRILEWKEHGVQWPSETKAVDQLANTILTRVNEASGIYQMFGVLGDIVIYDRDSGHFTYLEELHLPLISKLKDHTGHEFVLGRHSLLVVAMEYGKNFSGPGSDVFRPDIANIDPFRAHESEFLHPVMYFYHNLPTVTIRQWPPTIKSYLESDFKAKAEKDILPEPHAILHLVEDFTTEFNAPKSHVMPLRRFLEHNLGFDLRRFSDEQCMTMLLTSDFRKRIAMDCEVGQSH